MQKHSSVHMPRLVMTAMAMILVLMPMAATTTSAVSADEPPADMDDTVSPAESETPAADDPQPEEAGATTVVSVGSATVDPGESDTVNIRIDAVTDMGAFTVRVSFDNSVILITGLSAGTPPTTPSTIEGANAEGMFSASYFGATGISGNFVVYRLTFEAIGDPGAHSDLTLQVEGLVNSDTEAIPHTIEDGSFDINWVYDFGDAPDSGYATLLASTGARHGIVPGYCLGTELDWEDNGQPHAGASGDDSAGIDDEDGVTFTSTLCPDRTATVDVTASDDGFLDAWVDFDSNGSWSASEQVFDSQPLETGVNPLAFDVPLESSYTDGTYARFRFSSTGGLDYGGLAADGEVEDYMVAIEPTPPDPPTGLSATAYSRSNVALEWTRGTGADSTILVRAEGDFPSSPDDGTRVYEGDATSFTDSGLASETAYYYAAWAYNSATEMDSDSAAQATAPTLPSQADWTFMVYLDADNSLEGADDLDLAEMVAAGSSADVSIVVQQDRYSEPGTWRHYVTSSGVITVDTLEEQNAADPLVLADFIDWASTEYPAEHYALVLWNHGSGCLGSPNPEGIIYDDSSGDFLSIVEMCEALSAERPHIDLLGFDACLMQMYEVAYELSLLSDPPDTVVGSEEVEPFEGWPYDTTLDYLVANPGADAATLGAEIVSAYIASYPTDETVTLSAIQPSDAATLADTINTLAAALIASDYQTEIAAARAAAQAYYEDSYKDLVDFCDRINAAVPDCVSEAQALRTLVHTMVTAEGHMAATGVDDSHGLSIYLPDTPADYYTSYSSLSLATDTWWDDFLLGGHDHGDAPDSYLTLSTSGGAMHRLGGSWLGATVDAEAEAQSGADALGDDDHGDDEDGVTFLTPLSIGHTATIAVTASSPCFLDAWVDYNADGDWNDDGEQVFTSTALSSGSNSLSIEVPSTLTEADTSYTRFRVSSTGGLTPSGTVADGEVEDYRIGLPKLVEGDATRDHTTNIIDAMFIAQFTVGLRELDANQRVCADTNDDGEVTIVDAMHIAQYTVDPTGEGGVLFAPLWVGESDPSTDAP